MIKAFIIDDETPALEELEYLLKPYQDIQVTGIFDDSFYALQAMQKYAPDVVFLDIDMPSMNGLEVALKIQEMIAGIEIVFVTAYNEFALQAFELHALDYILKPIALERFNDMIRHVLERCRLRKSDMISQPKVSIRCFGRFEMTKYGSVAETAKWRTNKAKEIFAYLIHRHGKSVSKQELITVMFPSMNEKKALNNIYTNIYYIRKMLEEFCIDRSVLMLKDNYVLEVSDGICDYVDFERCIDKNPVIFDENVHNIEKIIRLYKGAYFEEEDYWWASELREYLERKYEDILVKLADYFIQNGPSFKAKKYLLQLLEYNPISEEANHCLLELLHKDGKKDLYIRHYQKYVKILDSELSIQPHAKYTVIYEQYCCNDEKG